MPSLKDRWTLPGIQPYVQPPLVIKWCHSPKYLALSSPILNRATRRRCTTWTTRDSKDSLREIPHADLYGHRPPTGYHIHRHDKRWCITDADRQVAAMPPLKIPGVFSNALFITKFDFPSNFRPLWPLFCVNNTPLYYENFGSRGGRISAERTDNGYKGKADILPLVESASFTSWITFHCYYRLPSANRSLRKLRIYATGPAVAYNHRFQGTSIPKLGLAGRCPGTMRIIYPVRTQYTVGFERQLLIFQ